MQGSFDGTQQIAMAAWDMANPNHPPHSLDEVEYLTTEELDSIWCKKYGWEPEELEDWRYAGEIQKGEEK